MRSILSAALAAAVAVCAAGMAGRGHAAQPAPAVVPNPTELAVYVPPALLKSEAYRPELRMWIEPGRALSEAVREVGGQYFPKLHLVPATTEASYGLLLDLDPEWSAVPGRVKLVIAYDVRDPAGTKLHSGTVEQAVPVKAGGLTVTAANAARLAIQKVMEAVQGTRPDPARFPSTGATSRIDYASLVDREKPLRTGTAFFINKGGQLLTAAHVSRDCMLLEAHQDGSSFPVQLKSRSDLLDVAVLESGRTRAAALPLRRDQAIVLGESVSSVGYPLKGLLGDSPNLTRGNVSASTGIRGSLGMFQFSAPIQPGNSGGPVVSDHGELLGMAVGTLNAEYMVKKGIVPQNVNFALDARHLATFLRREGVPFDVVQPQGAGSMQAANQAALSNTVQLTCYQ